MLTGAGVLLICNNKLVLGLDWTDSFADFGGAREAGMTLLETASKELFEETAMLFSITPRALLGKKYLDLDKYRCYLIRFNGNADSILREFILNKELVQARGYEWNEVSMLAAYDLTLINHIPLRKRTKRIIAKIDNELIESLPLTQGTKIVDKYTGMTSYYFN